MRAGSSALVLVALAACDRPSPLVLCHNANCASPDTTRDDTLPALTESLALQFDGRPALDGMELDAFWYGAESRCVFAHDLDGDTSVPAVTAAQVLADYLATTTSPSWNGERFYVFVDLKVNVGPSLSDAHTPEQLVDHAECGLDLLDTVAAGARAGGHPLTFSFISAVPRQLEVLVGRPRWQTIAPSPELEVLLVGDIFAPYSDVVPQLSDYRIRLDAVEYHPAYMTDGRREAYRSLGIELVQWSFISTGEAFDTLERWEPRFAITNEARLMRRWIEH